ncbi:Dihydroorotate dehydrogenase (quinone) [hydrothermal vent metagenome]|uniref:dihydroorotate dehydrogenase (quinone) n=1 Tax=hydrothermal vent metagenome TaxID=652676 RepID=A0A3B0U1X3_9ZZZZ
MIFSSLSSLLNNAFNNAELQNFTRNTLLAMEPETAHRLTLNALKLGAFPRPQENDPTELKTSVAGLELSNPVGMAAGFDKNAQVHGPLGAIGFGMVEVGTLTPKPQAGNPKPRLFRLMAAKGVINRMGFNNQGHQAALDRLKAKRSQAVLGVNIGANKDSSDFVADYVLGVRRFAGVADYLAINISSPNTPGLRDLQSAEALRRLLKEVLAERARQKIHVPVFLKLAPDLSLKQMDDIATIIEKTDLDGLIISNTTISRTMIAGDPLADEKGGLSGAPLFELATQKLAQMRLRVGPDLPIIGVGGVHDPASALAKFEAGANAIQLYSALVFGGLELLKEIKTGLVEAVRQKEAASISELVGTRAKDWAGSQTPEITL